jgi:L-iditol 2-dehydrogenase
VCFKELAVSGSNASIPSAWLKAVDLLRTGAVKTEDLITDTFPVTEWKTAFDKFDSKQGVKLLLTPAA